MEESDNEEGNSGASSKPMSCLWPCLDYGSQSEESDGEGEESDDDSDDDYEDDLRQSEVCISIIIRVVLDDYVYCIDIVYKSFDRCYLLCVEEAAPFGCLPVVEWDKRDEHTGAPLGHGRIV